MSAVLFHNDHYHVEFTPETRVIRLTRSPVVQSVAMLDGLVNDLLKVLVPLRPARVLIDMRLAPGNNDPAFEQTALGATSRLIHGFGHVAVLVQTAVGRLHFQRLNRENPKPLHVFLDEAEALRFLMEQPLAPP